MNAFFKEFREFAIKGNAIDLAVGVIIGAAFGKIVDSIVRDLIMPLAAIFIGNFDFSNRFVVLGTLPENYEGALTYEALSKAGVPLFAYGNFITVLINFLILALVIFLMVRQINRLKRAQEAAPPPPPPSETVELLRDIRDHLRGCPAGLAEGD